MSMDLQRFHATYFEERQVMMQDWADHLVQWRAAAHERP